MGRNVSSLLRQMLGHQRWSTHQCVEGGVQREGHSLGSGARLPPTLAEMLNLSELLVSH